MSKFGWSLPPGCKSSDIPGNRPEDIADEQIRDNIDDALSPLKLNERIQTHEEVVELDLATDNLIKLINNAWESGYAACQSDVDEARSYAALEHCDDARLDDPNTRGEEQAP